MDTDTTAATKPSPFVWWVQIIVGIGLVLSALAVVGSIFGYVALDADPTAPSLVDDEVITVPVDLREPVEFDDELAWAETGQGEIVDASTGKAPVFLGAVEAQLALIAPTRNERILYSLWQVAGPIMSFAALWQVFGMARSTRRGDPFTRANEMRLWRLAAIIAVGGFAHTIIGGAIEVWLVRGSAAADLVDIGYSLDLVPVIVGLAVAGLASIWHVGVGLRQDVAGTI